MANRNVLVLAELRNGEYRRATFEATSVGKRLATKLGGRVDLLAIGPGASDGGASAGRHGADRLLAVEEPWLGNYAPEAWAATLADAARDGEAAVVLAAGTALGRDVVPRAAAALRAACLSDLIEIDVEDSGEVRARRPVYSGKAYAKVVADGGGPIFATLRPNSFPIAADGAGDAEVVTTPPSLAEGDLRIRTIRVEKPSEQELDVAEAPIIVSGGRGLKEPANFALIRDLAEAFGAAVGASRAVVDAGWIPHSHQVGQTGKVVSPKLYVACGISGAIQHLAGMSTSKVIVAINKDPEAPIFKVATYGIVGDLFEVVPELTRKVRELRAAG